MLPEGRRPYVQLLLIGGLILAFALFYWGGGLKVFLTGTDQSSRDDLIPSEYSREELREFGQKFKQHFNQRKTGEIYGMLDGEMRRQVTLKKFRQFIQDEYDEGEIRRINYHAFYVPRSSKRRTYILYYNIILSRNDQEQSASLVVKVVDPHQGLKPYRFDIKMNPLESIYSKLDPASKGE